MFNRKALILKVLSKLAKESKKLSPDETMDIIFDNFVDSNDFDKKNYELKMKITDEQQDMLSNLYNNGAVKKLYKYSITKFGFEFSNLRFDVTPRDLEIKRVDSNSEDE